METFTDQKNFVLQHVLGSIDKYILGDLTVLDEIQPQEDGLKACAVPTAMVILSAIEFIGFLIKTNGKLGETMENIDAALSYNDYFPDIYKAKTKLISIVYRHGMMHSAFPKHIFNNDYYAVCKSQSSDLFIKHRVGSYNINSLNVNTLSKDFKTFFHKFKQEIESTSDESFIGSIYNKFMRSKIKVDDEYIYSISEPQTTMPIINANN
jgi:hypothetical protein